MSNSGKTTTYTIGVKLDQSQFISSYRQLLNTLSSAGGDPKFIKQMSTELNKAEKQMQSLQARSSVGFTDSKSMAKFNAEAETFNTKLQESGNKITQFAQEAKNFPTSGFVKAQKAVEDLQTKQTSLKQTLQEVKTNLTNMGFDQKTIDTMEEQVKQGKSLNAILEQELKNRQLIAQQAKSTAAQANQNAGKQAMTSLNGKSVFHVGDFNSNTATGADVTALNTQLRKSLMSGDDFLTTWNKLNEAIKQSGLELEVDLAKYKEIKAIVEELVTKQNQMANANGEQTDYASAYKNMMAVGDTSGGTFNYSPEMVQNATAMTDTIKQTAAVEDQLATATSEVSEKEQEFNATTTDVASKSKAATEGVKKLTAEHRAAAASTIQTAQAQEKMNSSLSMFASRITMMMSATTVAMKFKQVINETWNDIKELDDAFSSIALVTNKSMSDMWSSYSEYSEMASELGQKTQDVIKASAIFYQQG